MISSQLGQQLWVAAVVPRDEASDETLSLAIDRVLDDERVRETCARHAARLRASDPPGRAADLIEELI